MRQFLIQKSFSSLNLSIGKKTLADDYEITGFLGKGSTSRVFQGYNILTNASVILKLFKDIIPEQKIKRQIRANLMLKQCNHIIPFVEFIKDEGCGSYTLVFKNLEGVPLNLLIGEKTNFQQGLKYCKDILEALKFCHRQGIVHRDLKASNILITKNGAKLFDFGLCRIEGIDSFETKRFGTKCYYPPQVIFKVPHFTNKVDIWTCGVIMSEICSKKKPIMPYHSDEAAERQIVQFGGYDKDIVKKSALKYVSRINFENIIGEVKQRKQISAILSRMLSINPSDRPQASQILEYQIFKNI